jgi:hypothetical protein
LTIPAFGATVIGFDVHVWPFSGLPVGQGRVIGDAFPTVSVSAASLQAIAGAPVPVANTAFVAETCTVQFVELDMKFEKTPLGPLGHGAGVVPGDVGVTVMSSTCGATGVPVDGWPGVPVFDHVRAYAAPSFAFS